MADLQRTVSIIFQGEDRVSVTADGVTRSFTAVETSAKDAAQQVKTFDQNLIGFQDTANIITGIPDRISLICVFVSSPVLSYRMTCLT